MKNSWQSVKNNDSRLDASAWISPVGLNCCGCDVLAFSCKVIENDLNKKYAMMPSEITVLNWWNAFFRRHSLKM